MNYFTIDQSLSSYPFVFLFWLHAELMMNAAKKIPVTFSSTDINRLSIKNGRIKHVFGVDLFQVEKDEETGQIFLHVKEEATLPEAISMAFVADDETTQDILVSFKEGISKPIIFELPKQKHSLRQKAKQFLYDVLTHNTSTYIRQDYGESEEFEWGQAQFNYKILSREFSAEVFNVTGKKKHCIYNLRHSLFLKPNVCAVYLFEKELTNTHPVMLVVLKKR